MQRYFFNVADGSDFPDLEGTELADVAAARTEAIRLTGELLNSGPDRFWTGEEWTMTVKDVVGLTLFSMTFRGHNAPSTRV